jgi:hypothetical protein
MDALGEIGMRRSWNTPCRGSKKEQAGAEGNFCFCREVFFNPIQHMYEVQGHINQESQRRIQEQG